jgi:glutathione S-transferase
MTIELFVFPPSPHAFKVMAVANHLGLDWTMRLVDLRKGDQKSPQYAALNPNRLMPTLKDGDFVLWESNAIGQYLALPSPNNGIWPKAERAGCDVARWQFWELAHWDRACTALIFEYVVKPVVFGTDEPDMAAVAKGIESFHGVATVLDGQLRNRPFITGDTLTLADFSPGPTMNFAEAARFPIEPYREIKRWFAALSALPAWQKTRTQAALPDASAA